MLLFLFNIKEYFISIILHSGITEYYQPSILYLNIFSVCFYCTLLKISQDLKLKFYQLMIELDEHEGSYLAICKHYRAIYDTPQVKENKDKMKEVYLRHNLCYECVMQNDVQI